MAFDYFVLPFFTGLLFIVGYTIWKFNSWIRRLQNVDKKKFIHGFFTMKFFSASKEVFNESLLHRKMFKINPLMGYMHMSFAFGWLLLIVLGNLESRLYNLHELNLPYYPIFMKFFVHDKTGIPFAPFFSFIMDFILLAIIVGLLLALIKRLNSKLLGMKQTTVLKPIDKIGLYSLWLIFPLRLLAESTTSTLYENGGFLTGTLGNLFTGVPNMEIISYLLWWGYSIALGAFFFALPFTRYMHIPTEVLLIYLRNFEVKYNNNEAVMREIDIHACSRCGVCIDACQLSYTIQAKGMLPAHYFRALREGKIKDKDTLECMMCGRCKEICPVGLKTVKIRKLERDKIASPFKTPATFTKNQDLQTAEVAYFAGCMTHLTPSIIKSMKTIFDKANIPYVFVDEEAGVCCGRPQKLAGLGDIADGLRFENIKRIQDSGAKTFVTSCPICLNIFKKEYNLEIEVLHHTEFISRLLDQKKIFISKSEIDFTYHEPCELNRDLGISKEPNQLIESLGNLKKLEDNLGGFCCGGSLGSLKLSEQERAIVAKDVVQKLTETQANQIITSCPLCKSTLKRNSTLPVKDIAEVVVENLV